MTGRVFTLFLVAVLGGANAFGMTFDFRTPDQFNTIKVSINTSFGNGQLKGEIRGAGRDDGVSRWNGSRLPEEGFPSMPEA